VDIVDCEFACPYCLQANDIAVDCSCDIGQQLIQDCRVCCSPIVIHVFEWDGDIQLDIRTDNE
jgi:hypothetical protein